MASQHIVPMITERLDTWLTANMQTALEESNPIRANIVKVGRFQDNPLKYGVYIAIQGGDADDEKFKDGIVSLGDFENIHFDVPPREIGGGQYWWRRGVIQFGCYYPGVEEDTARNYAYRVLGKLCKYTANATVSDLIDEHSERAIIMHVFANTIFEGGGPPSNYVWRGKVYWTCLTERS